MYIESCHATKTALLSLTLWHDEEEVCIKKGKTYITLSTDGCPIFYTKTK